MALYEKIRGKTNYLLWAHGIFSIFTAIIAVTSLVLVMLMYVNEGQCCKENENGKPMDMVPSNPCRDTINGDIVHGLLETTSLCLGRKMVYCDKTTLGGGWLRIHYKTGAEQCTPFHMDSAQIKCLLENKKFDFAVSSDVNTLNSGQYSWTLSNASIRATDGPGDVYQVFEQVSNCNGPDGTPWTNDYANGYLYVTGKLGTLGTWSRMWEGCDWRQWANISEKRSFRVGGSPNHVSEFIHTSCNGYRYDTDYSITSKWNTNNVRAMWIKV